MSITKYGQRPETIPEGYAAKVNFPTLAMLDTRTGDGRLIEAAGFSVRDLPLSIKFQDTTAAGHDGAYLVGRLDEVTVEGLNVSGRGFISDAPSAAGALRAVASQMIRGNSVDLAEVAVRVKFGDYDFEDDADGFFAIPQTEVNFTKARIAATTICATPAFANATVEIESQLMASIASGFELTVGGTFEFQPLELPAQMTASATNDIIQPFDSFYREEQDKPLPLTVDADGNVFGNLGVWNSCHTGFSGECRLIPRSPTGYSSYQKSSVLTEKGLVRTGPIALYRGHPTIRSKEEVEAAYGGVENAWADVRITDGKHGPWLCGRVRPGASAEDVYAARASRLSGHWFGSELYAIVSVSAEGFNVPYEYSTNEAGELLQLVASFAPCPCNTESASLSDAELSLAHLALLALSEGE